MECTAEHLPSGPHDYGVMDRPSSSNESQVRGWVGQGHEAKSQDMPYRGSKNNAAGAKHLMFDKSHGVWNA